jgi:Icc-related predicted phosphoesterase
MKLLFVADLHYSLKQLDWLVGNAGQYNLVILGGDLLDLGSALDIDVQIVVIQKYLDRIRDHAPVLVCSGNHDGDQRNAVDESVAEWLLSIRKEGLYVDGQSVLFGDLKITACPWWDGPASRAELEILLDTETATHPGRCIWVHHAPPAGARVCWSERKSAGDPFLREWINRLQPDLVLSGHIHNAPFYPEGSWIDRIGVTWAFNPGRDLGPIPAHVKLDMDTLSAEWISVERRSTKQLELSARRFAESEALCGV